MGFNPGFILDALKSIASDKLQLEVSDSKKAGVIRADDNFVHVIMPMRLV